MVFVFDANSARDASLEIGPKPFRFLKVVGAQLAKSRLGLLRPVRDKPADDYRERDPHGL